VKEFGVHVAVSVTLPVTTTPDAGYVTPAAYVLMLSVHPAKVWPMRVKVFAGVVNVDP
jgi:hypothetical protein